MPAGESPAETNGYPPPPIPPIASTATAVSLSLWPCCPQDIGGEGVLIVHAAKQTRLDSGYWFVTLFAIRGRAFQPWPT